MLARDTWVNHFFAGHKVQIGRTKLETRVNYTLFHQLMDERTRKEFELRKSDFFFGAINKIRYRRQIGVLTVEPRWKSEFLKQTRGLFGEEQREQLRELFSVIVEMDFLTESTLQGGLEYLWNEDFAEDANDFRSVSLGLQLTNRSTYLGYKIVALAGMRLRTRDFEFSDAVTTNTTFVSVFAGLH